MNGDALLVSVVTPGANAAQPLLTLDQRKIQVRVIGYDPVSSLALLRTDAGTADNPVGWRDDANGTMGTDLQAMTTGGHATCRVSGRVKQVGRKILPFALLQVSFKQAVPRPGTPLLDSKGRVAAIIFGSGGKPNTGYAIPAEAVHRVRHDLAHGGHLVRGWLGISLLSQNKLPKVVKVIPNSPAATAGIRPNDLLLHIGTRKISDYADAVNAFFYQIPGQPVRVTVQRGAQQLEYDLTPVRSPGS